MADISGIFECKMCGHCCEGRGGIVLSPKDLARLAAFLGESRELAASKYAEISNGKLKIRAGADGRCIFFIEGRGCAVHEAKPDICRAWPFFRGNLQDPLSLEMAKDFCPGISPGVSFASFAREGLAWLGENGLVARDCSVEANALVISIPEK